MNIHRESERQRGRQENSNFYDIQIFDSINQGKVSIQQQQQQREYIYSSFTSI